MFEKNSNSKGIFFMGLFLALAMVASSIYLVSGIVKIKLNAQKKIYAKGSADLQVNSDLANVSIDMSSKDMDLKIANEKTHKKLEDVQAFLSKTGVPAEAIKITPPSVQERYKDVTDDKDHTTQVWDGYDVSQKVSVESKDVDLIGKIYDSHGSLLDDGVLVKVSSPQYLFTNTTQIKMDLLAEATKNARQRAEQIVKNSGSSTRLGALLSSSQGIFQITPLYSTETSWEGLSDTSSLRKSIRVVVSVEYALEN